MKKLLTLALALVMALTLAACGGGQSGGDVDYVKEKGTLIVGMTDFAPMDYRDESGEWIGFDADMAKAFAKSLGVEVQRSTGTTRLWSWRPRPSTRCGTA